MLKPSAAQTRSEAVPGELLPGPRAPAAFQTLQWLVRPPLGLYARLGARYGDAFRLQALGPPSVRSTSRPARHTLVVVSAPEHLRDVFTLSRHELRVGEAHRWLAWFLGRDSILTLDGEPHLEERRILRTVLRPGTLSGCERATRAAAARALARWPDAGVLPLGRRIREVAHDATLTFAFGPLDEKRLARLRRLVRAGASGSAVSPGLMVIPAFRADLGRLSPGGRLARARDELCAFVAAEIEARRARGGGASGTDMLGALLEANGGNGGSEETGPLVERLRILLGGAGNTAAAMSWCCLHVLRDPMVRERARAAAEEEDDPAAKAYLDAVCKESLRLNPPFVGAVRRVAVPVTVAGIRLRPGTFVVPCFYLTHRRPELYPEPERFRPERFLERAFSPWEYAPFGGGVRSCLGRAVALAQMRTILGELLRTFEVRPVGAWSRVDRRRNVLILPRDPLRAEVRRRTTRSAPVPSRSFRPSVAAPALGTLQPPGHRSWLPERLGLAALASAAGSAVLGHAFGVMPLSLTAPLFVAPSAALLCGLALARPRLPPERVRERTLASLVARGAVWGLVATLVYDAVRPPMRAAFGFEYDPFHAVVLFGQAITGLAGGHPAAFLAGWVYHFWDGISFGILFALLCPRGGIPAGLGWALVLQALLLAVYPRLVGVAPADPGFLALGFVGHAAFGIVLGAGVRRAARRAARRTT